MTVCQRLCLPGLIFAVFSTILFFACENEQPYKLPEGVDKEGIKFVNYGDYVNLEIRKYGLGDLIDVWQEFAPFPYYETVSYIMKSKTDLEEFLSMIEQAYIDYGLRHHPNTFYSDDYSSAPSYEYWESVLKPNLHSVFERYDEEFFKEFNLIIIPANEGDAAPRKCVVERTEIIGNSLNISIARMFLKDDSYDSEWKHWDIYIPVKKDYFNGEDIILNFREVTKNKI